MTKAAHNTKPWNYRSFDAVGVLIVLVVFSLSILLGLIATTGNFFIAGLLAAFAFGAAMIFMPGKFLLTTAISCLLIVGTIESFLSIPQANWVASILAAGLGFSVLTSRTVVTKVARKYFRSEIIMLAGLIFYLFSLAASILINRVPLQQLAAGLRAYLPFLGVFAVLYFGRVESKFIWKLIKIIIVTGCVQGLYCLIEKFFIAPRTISKFEDYEMMLGSFGGSFVTGGYTGEMAAFVCMNLVLCFILAQENIIHRGVAWVAALSAAISIGLAETKIVFLILPVMMATAFWHYPGGMSKKIFKASLVVALGLALIGGIYSYRFWDGATHIGRAFFYTFDPNFTISPGHRGRFASIIHWFDTSLINGPLANALFGYGPGSSIGGTSGDGSGVAGVGTAVRLYGPGLDISAITKLLWDVGLIGSFAFLMLIAGAFFLAQRLSNTSEIETHNRWIVVGLKTWVVVFAIMLPYQPAMLGGQAMQFLFWTTIGLIAYISKWNTTTTN